VNKKTEKIIKLIDYQIQSNTEKQLAKQVNQVKQMKSKCKCKPQLFQTVNKIFNVFVFV